MNALAKSSGDIAPPPPMSQPLAEAVAQTMNPHPDLAAQPLAMPDSVRAEANRRIRMLDARMKPATVADWAVFLRPLVASVRNPPSRDEFAAKASAIAFALSDVPAWMLSQERQRSALRRFDFWPSVAGLSEWLGPELAKLRAERSALARIVAAKPAPTPATEPATRTPEEIEAVRAKAEAFRAEMASRVQRVVPAAKARELVGHTLLAAWERAEADGVPGAALRVARLRQQLGMEAA